MQHESGRAYYSDSRMNKQREPHYEDIELVGERAYLKELDDYDQRTERREGALLNSKDAEGRERTKKPKEGGSFNLPF